MTAMTPAQPLLPAPSTVLTPRGPSVPLTTALAQQMSGLPAQGGRRLCGQGRTAGSLYLEAALHLSPGDDLGTFLIDPPMKFDAEASNIRAIAPNLRTIRGQTHLIDWVGSQSYPYPADFIEEARTMGVSRKISRTFDFTGIDERSTLIFYHQRGFLLNRDALAPYLPDFQCPCGHGHGSADACAGHLWTGLPSRAAPGQSLPRGVHTRALASGSYAVTPLPAGAPKPKYAGGLFARGPITRITAIRDPNEPDGSAGWQAALNAARRTGLPVDIEDL